MASANVLILNETNFDETIAGGVVLVDFWATWCGPCRMIAPMIDQLADEFAGKAKVCKVDVDECASLAVRFQVASIPTLILFKDGQLVQTMVGARPKAELAGLLTSAL